MKTPEEKYQNDAQYRQLVDALENMIHAAQFTPSELREAAVFAAIRHEMRTVPRYLMNPKTGEIKKL